MRDTFRPGVSMNSTRDHERKRGEFAHHQDERKSGQDPVQRILECAAGNPHERQPSSNSPIVSTFREENLRASEEAGSIPGLSTAIS